MRSEGYGTWFVSVSVCLSVRLCVCLSVCYHVYNALQHKGLTILLEKVGKKWIIQLKCLNKADTIFLFLCCRVHSPLHTPRTTIDCINTSPSPSQTCSGHPRHTMWNTRSTCSRQWSHLEGEPSSAVAVHLILLSMCLLFYRKIFESLDVFCVHFLQSSVPSAWLSLLPSSPVLPVFAFDPPLSSVYFLPSLDSSVPSALVLSSFSSFSLPTVRVLQHLSTSVHMVCFCRYRRRRSRWNHQVLPKRGVVTLSIA